MRAREKCGERGGSGAGSEEGNGDATKNARAGHRPSVTIYIFRRRASRATEENPNLSEGGASRDVCLRVFTR